ncbi:hypothetical protein Tco_0089064 [Tanacetum coccineum]
MSMMFQLLQAYDNERPQVDDQRLDLADDLKEAQDHISNTIINHKTKTTTSMYKISHEESKTTIIKESLVKMKQKGIILELKRRHLKKIVNCYNTPYPAKKIRHISASSSQEMRNDQFLIQRITLHQYVTSRKLTLYAVFTSLYMAYQGHF